MEFLLTRNFVSQNAHHFVVVAADVVDISDVKGFLLAASLFWERIYGGNKRCSARIPFWLTSWHRALGV